MSKKERAPKKWLSAFMFFCTEKRPEVVKNYPGLKFGEVGKKLGEMWRNLRDDSKEPYKQKSIKDKERYMKEIGKLKLGKLKGSSSDSEKLD